MAVNEVEALALRPDHPRVGSADEPVGATKRLAAAPAHNVETTDSLQRALEEVKSLNVALQSRTGIGEAVGLLIARYNVRSDNAFAMLVRESSVTNTKVRVSEAIVSAANSGTDALGGVLRTVRLH